MDEFGFVDWLPLDDEQKTHLRYVLNIRKMWIEAGIYGSFPDYELIYTLSRALFSMEIIYKEELEEKQLRIDQLEDLLHKVKNL